MINLLQAVVPMVVSMLALAVPLVGVRAIERTHC
jgi:hypothetical protein